MASTNTAKLLVGTVAVVIALVVVFGLLRATDTDTTIVLDENAQNVCVVTQKNDVTVKVDKFMIWNIQNNCDDQDVPVSVGNFRTSSAPSAPPNCQAATEGTALWPFQETTELDKRQHKNQIKLKAKKSSDLPGTEDLTYYFDVCLGQNADRKFDPRLVIDR